jgi:autotransporter-associated beta strand protein
MKFRRISPWLLAWWVLLAKGVPLMAVTIPVTQVTWSSTAPSSDFFAGSNWQGGVAPTSTQTGIFGSSTSGSIILFGSGTVGGLQFLSNASAFSFTSAPGAVLTIGSAGIADYSNLSQSLNIPLSFNSGTTLIQNFGTGILSLGNSGSALSMLSGASLQFTVAGKGSTVLQGSLSGTGSLTKDGSGTLTLYNTSSTFSGPTLVKQGTLSLPFTAAMPPGNVVTVNAQVGEARIDLGGSSQTFGQLTLGGVSTSGGLSNVVTLGSSTGYLTIGGTSAGSINYVASSSAATDPAMAIIKEGTVLLANGGTINVANSANAAIDLYVSSALAATGTITKTGAGTLMLAGGGTNLTGNLVASAGTLLVGSVFAGSSGSAVIEVQAGATLAGSWYSPDPTSSSTGMTAGNITVARPVTLRNGSQVGAWSYDQGKLILNGNVLVDTASTVKIGGAGGVQVAGALDATTTNATVSFGNANAQWRSVLGITGAVGANLSTLSSSGAAVIFSRAPTATSVYAASGGYIGIAPDTATGTAPTFASMAALVGSNKSGFAGTFGFDSAKSGATVTPYAELLDFSGFNTGMTIGSVTRALLSGPITPANPNRYAFGNGGGILAVTSNLGDGASTPRGLSVVSDTAISNNSLGLILRGANSFSGNVTVDNSFLVLDSQFAFPAKAGQGISLTTTTGAYLSATEQSNVSSFRRLMQAVNGNYSPLSILGFDSHGYIDAQILGSYTTSDRTVLEGLNLGAYAPFYLGSATRATLSGTLVAPAAGLQAGNRSLYLAGVGDGRLAVRSYLSNATGVDKVVLGTSTGFDNGGTVAIFGRNKYTGGTTLLSGTLEVGAGTRFSAGTLAAGPLGTGSLLVPTSALSPALSPFTRATMPSNWQICSSWIAGWIWGRGMDTRARQICS